jgi:hypothetical protein
VNFKHMRDLHTALKIDTVDKASAPDAGVNFVLARLQWSKDEIGFSLHAAPSRWSTSGMQTTDFLAQLGFTRSQCAISGVGQCYARRVEESFSLKTFGASFDRAFNTLKEADRHLEACGFYLDQPEG